MPVPHISLDCVAERFIAPLYRGMTEGEFKIFCMGSYIRLLDGMAPGIVAVTLQDDLNSGARAHCLEWKSRLMDSGVRVSSDPLRR